MKFAIHLFLMLLLFSTRESHAQTIIDLNNGGKVHAKALDDYDRKPEWKPEAKDSIEYADCLKRAFSALHCDSLAEAKHYFKSALKLQPTAKGNYIIELHLGNISEVEEAYDEAIYYAHTTFDDYLDECYGEVHIGNSYYPTSYVIKRINDTDYRMLLCDYEYRIVEEITEDEIDDDDDDDEVDEDE